MGVVALLEILRELHEQLHATLHVFEVYDFAWRVHVAQGNTDQARRDSASAGLNGARIRSGWTWVSLQLVRDFRFLRRREESLVDLRIDVFEAEYDGARSEIGLPVFSIFAILMLIGVNKIDGHRNVRI